MHQLLNLFGVGHHHQSGYMEIVAHLLPREGFSGFNHHGQHHNLDVGKPQLTTQEGKRVLH